MTNFEESLDMLTSGSNWVNNRNQKLVTALFITNTDPKLSPKFLEANPPQVAFLTEGGMLLSIPVDTFLNNHTFYNVNAEAEALIATLIAGGNLSDLLNAAPSEDPQDTSSLAPADSANKVTAEDVAVFKARPSTPIGIQFLTVDGDNRNPPLLTSEDLQNALLAVEQEPIIVERNGGLSHTGTRIALVFNNAPDFDKVVESVFDPASVTLNYAGFELDGVITQIDAYLGTTVQHNRAGSSLVVHLAQLEEQEEEVGEDIELAGDSAAEDAPSTTDIELAPAAPAPKDFSALAATLAAAQQAPAAVATTAQAAQEGGAVVSAQGQQAAQQAQTGGAAVVIG